MKEGSIVQAAVLDVSKAERLIDLSLKPEFVDKFLGESSKGQTHKKVMPYFLLYFCAAITSSCQMKKLWTEFFSVLYMFATLIFNPLQKCAC